MLWGVHIDFACLIKNSLKTVISRRKTSHMFMNIGSHTLKEVVTIINTFMRLGKYFAQANLYRIYRHFAEHYWVGLGPVIFWYPLKCFKASYY